MLITPPPSPSTPGVLKLALCNLALHKVLFILTIQDLMKNQPAFPCRVSQVQPDVRARTNACHLSLQVLFALSFLFSVCFVTSHCCGKRESSPMKHSNPNPNPNPNSSSSSVGTVTMKSLTVDMMNDNSHYAGLFVSLVERHGPCPSVTFQRHHRRLLFRVSFLSIIMVESINSSISTLDEDTTNSYYEKTVIEGKKAASGFNTRCFSVDMCVAVPLYHGLCLSVHLCLMQTCLVVAVFVHTAVLKHLTATCQALHSHPTPPPFLPPPLLSLSL
jgi:hypothetical protein